MDALLAVPTIYRWIATLTFVAIIVALSIAPGIERPRNSTLSWLVVNTPTAVQKALHVALYGALAVSWMWTLDSIGSRFTGMWLTLFATVGLGAILEWFQTRVPGRVGTVADVLLNLAGAVLGLSAVLLLM